MRAVICVLFCITLTQGSLLVENHKEVNYQPDDHKIDQHFYRGEEDGFSDNGRTDANIHWVTNIAIESTDNESLGGYGWHQRAPANVDETTHRLEQRNEANEDYESSQQDLPERFSGWNVKVGNPEGQIDKNDAGSAKDQKEN